MLLRGIIPAMGMLLVALFIATGSFFLGAVRGPPVLLVLAFAPFALMWFWLAWVRFSG
ncbi:MAG: hypothetical protein HYV16_13980 [Gammaproteobacteria bacterium]|nr:hypothetical protein [Gammaproteobacteria bacterium]